MSFLKPANEDKEKIEELTSFMLQTYFSRRNTLNDKKLDEIHQGFISLLQNKNNSLSENTTSKLKKIIDDIDKLMHNQETMKYIKSDSATKEGFIHKYENELLGNERTKYNMSDLYGATLITTDKTDGIKKNEKLTLKKEKKPHIFKDKQGRRIIITLYGQLMYEEWNGSNSYINLYKIQQETKADRGDFIDNLVYTNIIMPNMSDEHYRNLVLNDLLNLDNIRGAKCGGYIGEIIRQKPTEEKDTIHSEKQSKNGYLYRIDNDYVLKYDATDVTASMNMPVSQTQLNTKNQSNHEEEKSENMER